MQRTTGWRLAARFGLILAIVILGFGAVLKLPVRYLAWTEGFTVVSFLFASVVGFADRGAIPYNRQALLDRTGFGSCPSTWAL